jgi:hypothetical protein
VVAGHMQQGKAEREESFSYPEWLFMTWRSYAIIFRLWLKQQSPRCVCNGGLLI